MDSETKTLTPFSNVAQIIGEGEPTITRLVLIGYICDLCNQEHGAEIYFTAKEKDFETFEKNLNKKTTRKFLDDPKIQAAIARISISIHQEYQDYESLIPAPSGKKKKAPLQVTQIIITDESEYTCQHCGRTFESPGLLRMHRGENPFTLEKDPSFNSPCLGPIDRR